MKKISLVLFVYLACRCQAEDPTYTTKYDGIDLDEILANNRLLTGYVNCLLDLRPCSPDGKELKMNLPDAISNDCSKCTPRQQQGADQVMHYIIDHRPEDWDKLEKNHFQRLQQFTPRQQDMHYIIVIIDHRPQEWDKLEKKYNSDGTYKRKYLERKMGTESTENEERNNTSVEEKKE